MFRVGDRVECINDSDYPHLTKGKIYDVINSNYTYTGVTGDNGETITGYTSRFKLAEPKFKVGQPVRVVGDSGRNGHDYKHRIQIGSEVEIEMVLSNDDDTFKYAVSPDMGWLVQEADLEAIEEEVPFFRETDITGITIGKVDIESGEWKEISTGIYYKTEEETMAEVTREHQARHKEGLIEEYESSIEELEGKIEEKKERIEKEKIAIKNLRKYKTDREETIAQIKLAKGCKTAEAEAIIDLHEKGIKV